MSESSYQIGPHELKLEPPDIVFVSVVGIVTEAQAAELLTQSDRWAAQRDHQFWLVDASKLRHIEPAARRLAATWPISGSHWGTAAFGVSFAQRLLARLLLSAARILRGQVEIMVLVETEAEARDWITVERTSRQRSAATPTHSARV